MAAGAVQALIQVDFSLELGRRSQEVSLRSL